MWRALLHKNRAQAVPVRFGYKDGGIWVSGKCNTFYFKFKNSPEMHMHFANRDELTQMGRCRV